MALLQGVLHKVVDHVLLGNYAAAKNRKRLKENGVTHILIVGPDMQQLWPEDFTYYQLPLQQQLEGTSANILNYFDICSDFIDNVVHREGVVFVHCNSGTSRAPTILVAHFMKRYCLSVKTALKLVQRKAPRAQPNPEFMKQLDEFERKLGIQSKGCCILM